MSGLNLIHVFFVYTIRNSNKSQHMLNFTVCVGYYLSGQLWRHPVGSKGAMMTAVMEPTPPDGECLVFWYYMEGSGVGELTIHLHNPGSHRNTQKLWSRSGDQGKHWRHGRVTLLSPDSPYQVGLYLWCAGIRK